MAIQQADEPQRIYGWPELFEPKGTTGQPTLIGSRCSRCDYVAFPPLVVCPACLGEDTMARVELSRTGRLENFSIVQQAPRGFQAPYIQAFVRLPEGLLIFTHLAGIDPSGVKPVVGENFEVVDAVIRANEAGDPVRGYAFAPERRETEQ